MLDWLTDMSGKPMKKTPDSDMRDEYDFSAGVRGKYAQRYAEGTNVVVLDPDVAAKVKSSDEVNRILREHFSGHPKTGAV